MSVRLKVAISTFTLRKISIAGISFRAPPIEARLYAGEEIELVGGDNSVGQAIAFLAPKTEFVPAIGHMRFLPRRPELS